MTVNDRFLLQYIPSEAHLYQVNRCKSLGWSIDRYRIAQDRQSGIVNDPSGWFDPLELVATIQRIVHISVESVRIVGAAGSVRHATNANEIASIRIAAGWPA